MSRYWSETALFDWLRGKFGIDKPAALEWGGWTKWKNETKAAHPFGYWLTETFHAILIALIVAPLVALMMLVIIFEIVFGDRPIFCQLI